MRADPLTRQRRPWSGAAGVAKNGRAGDRDSTPRRALSEAEFLAHWDGVRAAGASSWTAKAHADQRTGSVQLTHLPDGRWLIHDFAGAPTAQLLADRGLCMADLFPARLPVGQMDLAQRQEMTARTRLARWRAGWNSILAEVAVVEIAGAEVAAGLALDDDDLERVRLACQRIAEARTQICQLEQHVDADHLGPRPGRFFADLGADHLTPPVARPDYLRPAAKDGDA